MKRSVIATSLMMLGLATGPVAAHPGSGIVVDAQGQVFFVDTGQGVWKIDAQGRLSLYHTLAYHWMALDEKPPLAYDDRLGRGGGGAIASDGL